MGKKYKRILELEELVFKILCEPSRKRKLDINVQEPIVEDELECGLLDSINRGRRATAYLALILSCCVWLCFILSIYLFYNAQSIMDYTIGGGSIILSLFMAILSLLARFCFLSINDMAMRFNQQTKP